MEKRKRGRPRNVDSTDRERQDDARNDEVIARCVGRLIWFGFPQRGENGVYATVARCAREVLGRVDRTTSTRQPLSAVRIEQIYENWKKQDWRRQWSRESFKKDSVRDRSPYALGGDQMRSLSDLAHELLTNGGKLEKAPFDVVTDLDGNERVRYLEDMIGHGDAEMAPKAKAAYATHPVITFKKKRGN